MCIEKKAMLRAALSAFKIKMIILIYLEPKHKNFKGPLQMKETDKKKRFISGAICPYQGLLNDITLKGLSGEN
jgi:hypothetical protein